MARNRYRVLSLIKQIQDVLDGKLAIGQSKNDDKTACRYMTWYYTNYKGYRKSTEAKRAWESDTNKMQVKADSKQYVREWISSRNYKSDLTRQIDERALEKFFLGEICGTPHERIYSWDTYRAYIKHCTYFANWAKKEHGCRTLSDARPYVDEWLQSRSDLSAFTQKLESAALAKLYNCHMEDFIQTNARERKNITRSRGEKVRDSHFSEEANKDLISFCKSTGLRRAELKALKGNTLVMNENGQYCIEVVSGSKGGRPRKSPIIGDIQAVVDRMQAAGDGPVWKVISTNADIHSYRSHYATTIYNSLARPRNEIPVTDRYCCRKDLQGTWYDKKAMLVASRALGHNRISVIAGHYLR